MTEPEFSRPVRVDTFGSEPRVIAIEADPSERAALARRFDLIGIDRLGAEASLLRDGAELIARGRVAAAVVQRCVASGDPVAAVIDAPFELLFRPSPRDGRPDEEVELGPSELDVVFYEGGAIDLGEAVAETLALSLDPYPRAPGADAALKAAGVKSEAEAREQASPFAALKDKLKK